MKQFKNYISMLVCVVLLISCSKSKLEKRPDKSLLVPTTFSDFQALLDNYNLMNRTPGFISIADGDYVIDDESLQNLAPSESNSYLWEADIYQGQGTLDWNVPYQQIFTSNVVLDGLAKINRDKENSTEWDNIKGSALFYRGLALFNLSQSFAGQYVPSTASGLPGLPIRTTSDINVKTGRGSLEQTYSQIINDIVLAEQLLPKIVSFKTRPCKSAAQALLARIYLSMSNYLKAGYYADICLQINHDLIDYSKIDKEELLPFPEILPNGNPEVLFFNFRNGYGFFNNSGLSIDPSLYQSYANGDLRRDLFFDETAAGVNYTGYLGLCTDEMYLIRAECMARQGNVEAAMSDLNTLLLNRWVYGKFNRFTALDAEQALEVILTERRKELIGRDLRWTDLRRLNLDKRFSVTLIRKANGLIYSLSHDNKRYILPIPKEEIDRNGLMQNER